MISRKMLFGILVGLVLVVSGCGPTGACTITTNTALTVYRLPDPTSDAWSSLGAGEEILNAEARTADGWIGFDPGVAQAPNVGLYRLRWVQDTITFDPSCADDLELVTLEDVLADMELSGGG